MDSFGWDEVLIDTVRPAIAAGVVSTAIPP